MGQPVSVFADRQPWRPYLAGPLEPGSTLLVSVGPGPEDGAVWLSPRPGAEGPFRLDDDEVRRDALAAARAAVPVLARPERWSQAVPRPVLLLERSRPHLTPGPLLRGDSFGLALALGRIAALTGVGLPPDTVAIAAVSPRGEVLPVDGFPGKLAALARVPVVRRVLVHPRDAERVRGPWEVVAVESLKSASQAVLPDLAARALAALPEDGATRRTIRAHFFEVVVSALDARPWQALLPLLDALAADPLDAREAGDLRVVRSIVARHQGAPVAVDEEDARLPTRRRPLRLALLAHLVQGWNDAVVPDWEARVDRLVLPLPAEGEEHLEDLRVLGALGRLQGAWGRHDEAVAHLERAWRGYAELGAEHEAARPACELLRLHGGRGDRDAVEDVLDRAGRILADAQTSAVSADYLALAAGRAWALLGEPGRARERLGAVSGTDLLPDVDRWLAWLGDPEARARRSGDAEQRALQALAAGEDALETLERACPAEYARLRRVHPELDPRQAVLRWWRY